MLRGKKVASGVQFYLAAASRSVQEEAERRGVWQILLDAGAHACCRLDAALASVWARGCSKPGEVGISATNRNFKGRMGSRDAQCYLGSPAGGRGLGGCRIHLRARRDAVPQCGISISQLACGSCRTPRRSRFFPAFPPAFTDGWSFCPQDNLNTDGIYGKDYTYREDMTPEMMARVVMENYDPQFSRRTLAGDVVVGGFNFGTGSSREQAVTALGCKGIPLVIAGSFSQTYLRNAFNNGFLCIESAGAGQSPALDVCRCRREQRKDDHLQAT